MAEQVAKLKKKQWYPIIAPKLFGSGVLGETIVYEPGQALGKTLSQSLMNLTNDVKRQNINIHFKVTEIEGNTAKTGIVGYEIVHSSVKRFVRKNSEKIDLSFTCDTADSVFLRVKPLIVTRGSIKDSIGAKIRHNAIGFLTKSIKKMTYEELLNELIGHKLQSMMKAELNKIYPLKICEIRYLGIEEREKQQEIKENPQEIKEMPQQAKEEVKEEAKEEAKEEVSEIK